MSFKLTKLDENDKPLPRVVVGNGAMAGLRRMMGLAKDLTARPERSSGFTRWIGEVSPGRWKSVWKGSASYKYGVGAREQTRRRRRILAGKIPSSQFLHDSLTTLAEARAAEYPLTSLERKAA